MAGGLILPTDNAVIDYSILSQIIAAINQQQNQINTLNTSLGLSAANTGGTSGSTTTGSLYVSRAGYQVPDGGATTGTTFTVSLPPGMTSISGISGTAYTGSTTATSCWLSSVNSTKVVFRTSAPAKYVYWTAVGK